MKPLPFILATLTGCFFADPINQRPSIEIEHASSTAVRRGDTVRVRALSHDPDNDVVRFAWRVQACTDATDPGGSCDLEPFSSSIIENFSFVVPVTRVNAAPVQSLRIVLEAKDELGATARPNQELLLPVVNAPPSLALSKSAGPHVLSLPLDVFAKVGDVDDGPTVIGEPTWVVYAPTGGTSTFVPQVITEDPPDLVFDHYGWTFTPQTAGDWEIEMTVRDPVGDATMQRIAITVAPDGPPCLAQLAPIVPSGGAALPLIAPILFRVPVVTDDLDMYPPRTDLPAFGATRFQWSIKAPGQATHQPIAGASGNSYALDPASYTPGDVVDLRVEIYDRLDRTILCPDAAQTCSVVSLSSCIQRQTWHLEVR